MTEKQQKKFLNLILIFIILQPFFDILSFLSIRNIIPFNISTYVKPLLVFSLCFYMLFFKNQFKKKWLSYISLFCLFVLGHFLILFRLLIPISTILHEFRYIINIAYMMALFISVFTLYYHYDNKIEFLDKLKKTIMFTFLIYCVFLLIAVFTGTSAMTYEYSDGNKLGYKGWFDSGQILGHSLSILFPILLYTVLRPQQKWYVKIGYLFILVLLVSLLGTKVPYYIIMIVLILYLFISIFIKIFNKEFKRNYFNIIVVMIFIVGMFVSYKYTPVHYNTELNHANAGVSLDNYDMDDIDGSKNVKSFEKLIKDNSKNDVDKLVQYNNLNIEASNYLMRLYKKGKVHPSDMRKKQFYYSSKKFELSTFEYKLFGIGYLNQEDTLAMESDFFMALFAFGILGFALFLFIPIIEFIKATVFILKNLKKIDLETYLLYMGLGIFFCISIYAGYTYIYTNFSIFLVMLITMLKLKIDLIKDDIVKHKKNKKIDFLLLHLGFGGIESATINSANALVEKKYDVRIVSFYHLNNNQESKLSSKVKIKYLYEGEPNRDLFKDAVKNKNLFKILKEGIKASSILIKKRVLVIKYILCSKSDVIVSTRVEFNVLLSKYGKFDTLKIAQEHHYHNNDKKYINKIKNCYYGIDYLCALTNTLKRDYEIFLKSNKKTKVILLPNMLYDLPKAKSNLNNKNIVTVSRFDVGKKNDDILRAFAKLNNSDYKLIMIGDGSEYDNLLNLSNELKISNRVIFTGFLGKKDIEKYLLKSDLYLMASITEGLPMVLLEAMSYGIPCIAYETESGVNDIIDSDVNGYVVKNRDFNNYIAKINYVIDDFEKRKQLGIGAVKKSKQFYKDEILKIWKQMLM